MACIYFKTVLNDCFQIRSDAKYFFLSCPRHCDQGLLVVILFSNMKQKRAQHYY